MNYCTIQEAWGQGNYISKQYKTCNNDNKPKIQKKPIENFENFENSDNSDNSDTKIIKKKETFKNSNKNKSGCDNFINHMKNCRQCQLKMRDQFRPKILENFEDIIQTNRDIIVLILVGLCFMIFFNMITNITSNNKNN